jgi:hypothetical protein
MNQSKTDLGIVNESQLLRLDITPSLYFYSLFKRSYSLFKAIKCSAVCAGFEPMFPRGYGHRPLRNLLYNSAPYISVRLTLIFRYRGQPRVLVGVTICTKQLLELFDGPDS